MRCGLISNAELATKISNNERWMPGCSVDMQMLQNTRVMLINGFLFDELPAHVVLAACKTARASGAAVFFDPGPRAWTLPHGVLQAVLDVADVVIATQASVHHHMP